MSGHRGLVLWRWVDGEWQTAARESCRTWSAAGEQGPTASSRLTLPSMDVVDAVDADDDQSIDSGDQVETAIQFISATPYS